MSNVLYYLQVKKAVRRVFCSYLSLLVNAKDDMALVQTLDVPSRSLGRQALTDIKHAARHNNTSLFLVRNAHILHVLQYSDFNTGGILLKKHFGSHTFSGCDIFCESHPARRKGLRSSWVGPTEETCQKSVWVCPVSRQPWGNTGGDSWPKVNNAASCRLPLIPRLATLNCLPPVTARSVTSKNTPQQLKRSLLAEKYMHSLVRCKSVS